MKAIIEGFPDYSVDTSGNIYNRHGKVVGSNDRASNASVSLTKDGKVYSFLIKNIVAEHFLEKPSEFHTVICYKTDNDKNNSVDNIEWCISTSEIKLRQLIDSRFDNLIVKEVVWFCRLDNKVVNTALLCDCDCGSVVTLKKCELERKLKYCNCDRKQNLIELREKSKAQEIELSKYGWRVTSEFNIEQKFNTLVCEKLHKPKINIEKWNKLSSDEKFNCPECVKALEKSNTWENINRLQFEAIEKGFVVSAYTSRAVHVRCEKDHITKVVFNSTVSDKCLRCENDKIRKELGLPATYGFDINKPAILYYLRVDTGRQHLYKIGVTNYSVEKRYKTEKAKYVKVWDQWYESGGEAYREEQRILKYFQEYRYKGDTILNTRGNTELFICDVLERDFLAYQS
jgi:hypothetical protein